MASLLTEVRDAIRGTGADYTTIPLRRAVFLLAVPMVLELVLESTFAVVDIWFVARLGPSAVATADGPSFATNQISTTAKVDSSTSSITIGTASRNTARRIGMVV